MTLPMGPRQPEARPTQRPQRRGASTLVAGGLVAALLVAAGAWGGLGELGATVRTEEAFTGGASFDLSIGVDAANVSVEYGNVTKPTFTYRVPWPAGSAAFHQSFDPTTSTLSVELKGVVSSPVRLGGDGATLTVALPRDGRLVGITVQSEEGSIRSSVDATKTFLQAQTGSLDLSGTFGSATVSSVTGSVRVRCNDAAWLVVGTQTGSLDVVATGTAPAFTALKAGTGSISATMPPGRYTVSARTGVGSVTNQLPEGSEGHVLEATTSTGSIVLTQG